MGALECTCGEGEGAREGVCALDCGVGAAVGIGVIEGVRERGGATAGGGGVREREAAADVLAEGAGTSFSVSPAMRASSAAKATSHAWRRARKAAW